MAGSRTVIATTGEDDRYAPVRAQAMERARSEGARLILYDLDAGTNPLESPLPTEWSAEGEEEAVPDRLSPEQLEAAGRAPIADQVRAAREAGLDAWGWLPAHDDRKTLDEYAARYPGATVLAPEGEGDLASQPR